MKKYITAALVLLTITISRAQNPRTDTSTQLSVYNTGVRFKLVSADFGGTVTQDLVATMVRSYDTAMVLKENAGADTTGRKPIRYKAERRCNKMSGGLKGKIVVMELNKDCDVTQTCLNVQRAGAKAFVIIHNSNSQGNIKLPKQGLYKDSIRIPIYTVGSNVGDSITALLPTVVGIRKPVATTPVASIVQNNNELIPPLEKVSDKMPITSNGIEELNIDGTNNGFGISKQVFSISPNPTRDQADVTYQLQHPTDVTIEVKTASGQVIFSKILRGVTVGSLDISTVDYPNGTYFVTLQYEKEVKTKKLVVRH
jgi:PA domain/Secretion system C-terminal sorting domain